MMVTIPWPWYRGRAGKPSRAQNRFDGPSMLDVLALRLELQLCVGCPGTATERVAPT